MRVARAGTVLFWIAATFAFAQSLPSTKPELKWLQWDVEHLHELDSKDAVGVARGFTVEERRALIRSFEADLRPSIKQRSVGSEAELQKAVAENTFVEKIDLDGDGTPEVIVEGAGDIWGASPTGNGPIWVLRKTPKGYKTLIDSLGQNFSVMKTRTNGLRDLMVGMHGSATEQGLKIYHFRNGRYSKEGCYMANWSVLVNGEMHDLRTPVITRCGHRF